MDLNKILASVENSADIIKQIEAEIGREFIPRSEFNTKNNELKTLEKQLGELKTSLDGHAGKQTEYEKQIAELNNKTKTYELQSLKARIAHEKNIPYELAGRLTGEDEKTLREDAESLSRLIDRKPTAPPLKSTEPAGDDKDAPYKALLTTIKGE